MPQHEAERGVLGRIHQRRALARQAAEDRAVEVEVLVERRGGAGSGRARGPARRAAPCRRRRARGTATAPSSALPLASTKWPIGVDVGEAVAVLVDERRLHLAADRRRPSPGRGSRASPAGAPCRCARSGCVEVMRLSARRSVRSGSAGLATGCTVRQLHRSSAVSSCFHSASAVPPGRDQRRASCRGSRRCWDSSTMVCTRPAAVLVGR